jgi:hypothetical protein
MNHVSGTTYVPSANNVEYYTSAYHTTTVNFNDTFDPIDVTLVGYTFKGWFVSYSALTDEEITEITTDKYLIHKQTGCTVLADNKIELDTDTYEQDFAYNATFTWRYTNKNRTESYDIYAYAYYTVNERDTKYRINYYIPKNNLVGSANNTAQYELKTYTDVDFNETTFTTYTTALDGYTFQGWYVSTSPVNNAVVVNVTPLLYTNNYQTNTIKDNDQCNLSEQLIGDLSYQQNWFENDAFVWDETYNDATNNDGNYKQVRTYERQFTWRYTSDLYAYAVYTVNVNNRESYTISYYVPQNNLMNYANDLSRYTTGAFNITTAKFNEEFTTLTVSLIGYAFRGWYISYTPLTSGKLGETFIGEHDLYAGVTVENLTNYQINCNLTDNYVNKGTSAGQDVRYVQNWAEDNVNLSHQKKSFTWRYNRDVYAYAYYTRDELQGKYNVYYYVPQNNSIGYVNDISKYTIVNALGASSQYYTEEVIYNEVYTPIVVDLVGYDFKGWFVNPRDKLVTGYVGGVTSGYVQDGFQENKPGGDVIITDDTAYLQNWTEGEQFTYRYTCDVYVYAYYEVEEYNVNYYVPQTNKVGDANVVNNYQKVNGLSSSYTSIKFNDNYKTLAVKLEGYTFIGWQLSLGKPLSNIELSAVTTPKYLTKYQVHTIIGIDDIRVSDRFVTTYDISTDQNIGQGTYFQDWSENQAFVWNNPEGYNKIRDYEREFVWRYDYRNYIDNMARMKFNELIVWNDYIPLNMPLKIPNRSCHLHLWYQLHFQHILPLPLRHPYLCLP